MRRIFIIRKDLNLRPGKLAAMVAHCAEAYFTNMIKKNPPLAPASTEDGANDSYYRMVLTIPRDVMDNYIMGIFTKTICECKNKEALHKVDDVIKELKLVEGTDYGYINDRCLTELTPENQDGTCTVGMWFKPLPDEDAHKISKKFKLYGVFDKTARTAYAVVSRMSWCEGENEEVLARYSTHIEAEKHLKHLFDKMSYSSS